MVGSYAVVGRIGGGGQGTVYGGTAPDGAQVAIKVLHSHLSLDARARARFLNEVEAAKRVAPFCTVQVLDSGVLDHRPFLVSEYVPGPSLQEAVADGGPRSGASLDRLAVNTVTALAAIHRAGVVHRDFKPANVLLGPDGPVVIDFGIARALVSDLSTTSHVVGSPSYMSPEQIANGPVGPPADLFAWGAAMFYAATGERAFTGDSIPAIMQAVLHAQPDLTRLAGPLRDIVTRCLAKAPDDRPTAEEVAALLLDRPAESVLPAPSPADGASSDDVTRADPPEEVTRADDPAPTVTKADGLTRSGVVVTVGGSTQPGSVERTSRRGRRVLVVGGVVAAALAALYGVIAFDFGTESHKERSKALVMSPTGSAAPDVNGAGKPSGSGRSPKPEGSSSAPRSPGPSTGSSKASERPRSSSKPTRKPSRKPSGPPKGTPIGTMPYSVIDPYCRSRGYTQGVTLANGPFCVTKSGQYVAVNMNLVCRYRFPSYPRAVIQSYNSVGGWTCLSS